MSESSNGYEPRRTLVLKTAPAAANTLITLAQAKAQLRVDHSDDDTLIGLLIDVAVAHLDPSGKGHLGKALLAQTWTLKFDRFPSCDIRLPFAPLIAVNSVKYYDTGGTLRTFASSSWQVDAVGDFWHGAKLMPAPLASWPSTQSGKLEAVEIEFQCGHATADNVPASIRHALLLLIGHWYENREAVTLANLSAVELPKGVDALLAPLRVYY